MTATEFFHANADYSYDPATETAEQGRTRRAVHLAMAETWAAQAGYSFEWLPDWEWEGGAGEWGCVCHSPGGEAVASLWSVGFEDGAEPWGQPYRRVVQAELALEVMPSGDSCEFCPADGGGCAVCR